MSEHTDAIRALIAEQRKKDKRRNRRLALAFFIALLLAILKLYSVDAADMDAQGVRDLRGAAKWQAVADIRGGGE